MIDAWKLLFDPKTQSQVAHALINWCLFNSWGISNAKRRPSAHIPLQGSSV
jgi:hypothetical protein